MADDARCRDRPERHRLATDGNSIRTPMYSARATREDRNAGGSSGAEPSSLRYSPRTIARSPRSAAVRPSRGWFGSSVCGDGNVTLD